MADNLMERIEELAKLEAAATAGEWWVLLDDKGDAHVLIGDQDDRVCCCHEDECKPEVNAQFIAAARNTVPDLIAAYRAALTALEASHRERDAIAAKLAAIADYCRARLHPGVNPGTQATCGEVLKMVEGQ